MGTRVFSEGSPVEEWDDATKTYRRYDAAGALVETRSYNSAELAELNERLAVVERAAVAQGIRADGAFMTRHTNGLAAVEIGPSVAGNGDPTQGLVVHDRAGATITAAFINDVTGNRFVQHGSATSRLTELKTWAGFTALYGPTDDSFIKLYADGNIELKPDLANNRGVMIGHPTTANTANCYIAASGYIYRSTSSRRYKCDERPAVIDTAAVLALQPRVFRSVAEVEDEGDAAPTHVGFIAEEAADLGLDLWVTDDDDGLPEAFSYASWCVAQQAVIQEQHGTLQQQAALIADLTARVTALEAASNAAASGG